VSLPNLLPSFLRFLSLYPSSLSFFSPSCFPSI
jgi:hypothetical protein